MRKNKGGSFMVITTLAVAMILIITVAVTITNVNHKMKEYCFDELESTSKNLAKQLYDTSYSDRSLLSAMAEIISGQEDMTDTELASIMKTFDLPDSYISYIAVLTSDGWIMNEDGDKLEVSQKLDFTEESRKGTYISEEESGIFDPEDQIIRNAVPVVRNGETIAILYGVISLTKFSEIYTTDIYDNSAYVYLEEGISGKFLLDTWHKELGNIEDFRNRKTAPGYDFDTAIAEMREGRSGNLCFVSNTTGKTIYLHYEPTGINDWNVMVSVDDGAAFKKTAVITGQLYVMAGIVGVVLVLYMALVLGWLTNAYRRIHKLDIEDKTTALQNRNAYDVWVDSSRDRMFEEITCVYIDGNGLHEINNQYGHNVGDQMLRMIANALKNQFPYDSIYRIGGDEFVAFCEAQKEAEERIQAVAAEVEKHEYSISYGIVTRAQELGLDRVIKEADDQMLQYKRKYYETHNRRKARE